MSSLNIQNAVVYAVSADGTIYALSLPTGKVIWQQPFAMPSTAPPLIKYGLVFVGSNEPAFCAFDALKGAPAWKLRAAGPVSQAAAFDKGRIFFADDLGLMTAAEAVSGKVIWRTQLEGPLSAPCIVGERVCVATPGRLYCLLESTGELLWSLKTGSSSLSSPAGEGGTVFIGAGEGQLLAVRASDGSRLWSVRLGGDVVGGPWLQGGKAFVAAGGRVLCLGKDDGHVLWKTMVKGTITTPAGADGRHVFVATDRGIVYVLDAGNGRRVWRRKGEETISGRIVAEDGSLLFGTWGREIRAVPLPGGL